jgi:hypothetical protein
MAFAFVQDFFQNPFSSESYVVLKEAEQFIWAGSEMDPVSSLPQCFSFYYYFNSHVFGH